MDSTVQHFPSRLCGNRIHIKLEPILFPVSSAVPPTVHAFS
jgi:hypothetical protein